MGNEKSYEAIIEEIHSGLTGTAEDDIRYLQQKISEYEEHEDRDRIAGICGQMIYGLLPEDLKEEFSSLNGAMRLGIDEYSAEAAQLLCDGNSEGAAKKLEEGIAVFEDSDLYHEKDGVPFYDFRKPMEEALFREEHGFEKRIKLIPEPVVGLYRMYAGILYERGEYEKALVHLEKALRYNPYHQKTSIEYADNLRELGRLEEFKDKITDTFTFAYEPEALGKCYRRLGWYFSEKEKWDPAAVCAILAGKYDDDNEVLKQEKEYIRNKAGDDFVIPQEDEFESIAAENGFPSEPDMYLTAIANTAAKEFEEIGNVAAAKYFYNILYDLTRDEEIRRKIGSLQDRMS